MKHASILASLFALHGCHGSPAATSLSSAESSPPASSNEDRRGPGDSFIASAAPGISLNDLGRPFTQDFQRFQGSDGRSLFPKAGPILRTPQHLFEHDVDTIDTVEELAANAGAWGIRVASDEGRTNRYASLRVLEIDDVREIDDTTPMQRAPQGAVYYPWRIYMGRSYEVVLEGTSERFHAGVRASLLGFTGNISGFAAEHELTQTVRGRGLAPRNDRAIFARTTREIESHYRSTIDEPVPILVEWRRIPGRRADARPIQWTELRRDCAGEPGCEPCERWSFDRIEVSIPGQKSNGAPWDADDSAPDVVLSLRAAGDERTSSKWAAYQHSWRLDPAVVVDANVRLRLRAIDKDLMSDDPIFALNAKPGGTLKGGRLDFGAGSAVAFGRCTDAGASTSGSGKNSRP